ncbi:MAG: hypothetical protein MJ252_10675 [archaeon]|nr:hypothetical protein [archaeon]
MINSSNLRCEKCRYHLSLPPIEFNCGHKYCPFCLASEIIFSNFNNIKLLNKKDILIYCQECSRGEVKTSIDILADYFRMNQKQFPECPKHKKTSKFFCKKCNLYLCEDCLSLFHNIYFKDHKLQSKVIPAFGQLFCPIHENKMVAYKCENCDVSLCYECLKEEEHKNHSKIKLDDLMNENIKKLKYCEYEYYSNYLSKKEMEIKDKLSFEMKKEMSLCEKIIERLKKTLNNYKEELNRNISFVSQMFNLIREIYYYYFLLLTSNDKEINPLLKEEYREYHPDINLLERIYYKKNFNFLSMSMVYPNSYKFLVEINEAVNKYNEIPEINFPISKVILEDVHKIDLNELFIKSNNNINRSSADILGELQSQINQSKISNLQKIVKMCNSWDNLPPIIDDPPKELEIKRIKEDPVYGTSIQCIDTVFIEDDLIACDQFGRIYVFDIKNNFRLKFKRKVHEGGIIKLIKFKQNEDILLASASKDKTWQILIPSKDYEIYHQYKGHKDELTCIINLSKRIQLNEERTLAEFIKNDLNEDFEIEDKKKEDSGKNSKEKEKEKNPIKEKENVKDNPHTKEKIVLFATGSKDSNIKIWLLSKNSKKCLYTLTGHKKSISCILKIDSEHILSSSEDFVFMLWNFKTYSMEKTMTMSGVSNVDSLFLFSKKNILIPTDRGGIRFMSLELKFEKMISIHDSLITSLKFVPYSRFTFSASKDGSFAIWDLEKRECLGLMKGHIGQINCLSFTDDYLFNTKFRLATGDDLVQIIIWEEAMCE